MRQNKDLFEYMDRRRETVCEILDKSLDILNDEEKLREASPAQLTTTVKTLIDKWTEALDQEADLEDLTPLAERLGGGPLPEAGSLPEAASPLEAAP